MPDGTNTNASRQVVSALNSIPFGNIIGGPLAACVQAQAEAAQTTLNYIRGFTMTESHLDVEGAEPITVSFSFIMEGVPTRMTVPLMTIVPIPYMRIEHVDLSFTADITACDNEKMEAKFASEGYQGVEEDEKSVSMQSKMGVHVRASTGDIPSGMAKMLDFFANNLVVQETLTTKEVEDMKLEAARQRAIRKNDMVEKERIEAQQALERQKQKEEERKKKEAEDKYRYGLIAGLVQGVKKRKLRLAEEELKRILRVIEEEEARCNKIAALVEAVKKRRERLDEEVPMSGLPQAHRRLPDNTLGLPPAHLRVPAVPMSGLPQARRRLPDNTLGLPLAHLRVPAVPMLGLPQARRRVPAGHRQPLAGLHQARPQAVGLCPTGSGTIKLKRICQREIG